MKTAAISVLSVILAFVLIIALMMVSTGLEIFGLRLGKHVENARTGVTRSTDQYVTSAQQQLAVLAKEYNAAKEAGSAAQMKLIAEQMNTIAIKLDPQYVTTSQTLILSQEGF